MADHGRISGLETQHTQRRNQGETNVPAVTCLSNDNASGPDQWKISRAHGIIPVA
jgi:hypothetical protein